MKIKVYSAIAAGLIYAVGVFAQTPDMPTTNAPKSKYNFTIIKDNGCTSVKNQYKSGTCWCFSSQSFLESEVMRMGKIKTPLDLSEMFVVHNMYLQKAKHYMQYQGHANFGEGGEPHDVINAVREFGIVPKSAYLGIPQVSELALSPADDSLPVMTDVADALKAFLDALLKAPAGHLNANWFAAYSGALDGFMGKMPTEFTYDGKKYTPKSFAQYLGINPDDYVEISSFNAHPYYKKFILEVPDNWANAEVYNVPLDDLRAIADNALNNGYTVEWGADVSEPGFSPRFNIAVTPQYDMSAMRPYEPGYDSAFLNPVAELKITPEMRQDAFDLLATTDDHGMQITGLAKDQNNDEFYIVKNSWGTKDMYCHGYLYVSSSYFLYKTTAIMVNKNAIPKDIRKKMGIE